MRKNKRQLNKDAKNMEKSLKDFMNKDLKRMERNLLKMLDDRGKWHDFLLSLPR